MYVPEFKPLVFLLFLVTLYFIIYIKVRGLDEHHD